MGEGESLLTPSGSASEVSNTLAGLRLVSCLDLDNRISVKHVRTSSKPQVVYSADDFSRLFNDDYQIQPHRVIFPGPDLQGGGELVQGWNDTFTFCDTALDVA